MNGLHKPVAVADKESEPKSVQTLLMALSDSVSVGVEVIDSNREKPAGMLNALCDCWPAGSNKQSPGGLGD